MKRFMLTVAYDGTAYCGYQIQKSCPTIEGTLTECLSELLHEEIHVIGGSRTDAGVHALCNVAVFDSETNIPGEKLSYALNQRLPEDIRIMGSKEVNLQFHPRHCDTRKTYEYRISLGEFSIPTKRLYTYFTYHKFDITKMQQAATYLEGEHDFKSFAAAASVVENTIRTIYSVKVIEKEDEIIIQVCGNGFLYNMVRIIAGTLMDTGRGKWEPEHMKDIIEARDRQAAGPTAPACGLILIKYEFVDNDKEN